MKIVRYFVVLLFSFSVACGSESAVRQSERSISETAPAANAPAGRGQQAAPKPPGSQDKPASPAAGDISLQKATSSQTDTAPVERKIIRNADLSLEADKPEDLQQKITAIAESKGGFVIESQQSSSDVKISTRDIVTMTIRVPAAKFGETLDEIRKAGGRVIVETVKGDDVTVHSDQFTHQGQKAAPATARVQHLPTGLHTNVPERSVVFGMCRLKMRVEPVGLAKGVASRCLSH